MAAPPHSLPHAALEAWSLSGGSFSGASFMQPPQVKLAQTLTMGAGLTCIAAIHAGERVLTEPAAAACAMPMCDAARCMGCLRSLAPPPHELPLPKLAQCWPRLHACAVQCKGGCGALFCSPPCERLAAKHHGIICPGPGKKEDRLLAFCRALPLRLAPVAGAPLLALRLAAHALALRRQGVEDVPFLSAAPIAGLCEHHLPASTLLRTHHAELLRRETLAQLRATPDECEWVSTQAYAALLGRVLANQAQLRPRSAFDAYGAALRASTHDRDARSKLVDALLDCGPEGKDGDRREALEALEEPTRVDGTGVFRLHSKFNHSCTPNCEAQSHPFEDASIDVICIRDVHPGEALTISYCDPKLSRMHRRRVLKENHGFDCACTRCFAENDNL